MRVLRISTLSSTVLSVFILLFAFACGDKSNGTAVNAPDSKDLPLPENPMFQLLDPAQSGISFQNEVKEDYYLNVINFSYLYNGAGVGILDVNNDGLQDIFFSSTTGKCKLYLNKGNMQFKDITGSAHVDAAKGIKTGVSIVDVNNDGWQDIYLCRTGQSATDDRRNLLFVNNQDGTFVEAAQQFGLDDASACTNATFFDYDNDGDLDMYLLVYPDDFSSFNKVEVRDMGNGQMQRQNTPSGPYDSDRLYRNNGNGTFTDVSQNAGIWNRAFALSANVFDFNGDGYLDIYVCNDYLEPDFFYINNGKGGFTEQNFKAFRHTSENSMGSELADLNNDGFLDLFALDMLSEDFVLQKERLTTRSFERYTTLNKYGYGNQQERNILSINNGNGSFSDVACLAGVFQTDWSWSVLAQDFDNDGWKDVFITNGYRRDVTNADYIFFTSDSINKIPGGLSPQNFKSIYDYFKLIPEHKLQNYMFHNRGDLQYDNVSTDWGLVQKSFSNGGVYADLDNDGDLDLVVNNIEREAFVYRNQSADRKQDNWLQIKIKGNGANPGAIGARARLTTGDQIQYQELYPVRGFMSSVEPIFHFGLGKATQADKLEIEFPGKRLVVMNNVPANQRLIIDVATAKPGKLPAISNPPAIFKEATGTAGLVYKHIDDEFQDFTRERLLPWRTSAPGPALATGDANGDGRADVFIGGGAGTAAALLVQTPTGAFQASNAELWATEQNFEDAAALFVDVDKDGDQDLVVLSGGSSAPAGSAHYQARLYLNDGKGKFARSNDGLPSMTDSGAAVLAYDYDGDGDQDLFLGGWCVPGAYPTTPASHVLQNNNGKFTDMTQTVSPDFGKFGMVRDLCWADLDKDGKEELVVVGEWTPVGIFKWKGGKLENVTAQFGLENTQGFWRSVAVADLDGDGDQDLVCGNLGWNTRLRASASEPIEMYAYDFDGNGSIDPIMTRYFEGKRFPWAIRDQMIKQIPSLKKKFVRYGPYARSTIEDIYPSAVLSKATHFQCNMLESVVMINDNGKFRKVNLPNEAQIAPVCDILIQDLNGDKIPDLIIVGNDYGMQVETGRIDSGNGLVLLGDGKGGFKPVPARQSGLWASKEARHLAMVNAGGKQLLLIGNNDDVLQVFGF